MKKRRVVVAVALSLALVATLIVAIVTNGIVPPPSFPSLRQNPDARLTGTIAYAAYNSETSRHCLWTITASGADEPHQVVCNSGTNVGFSDWAFDRDGNLVVVSTDYGRYPSEYTYSVYDIRTNLVMETFVRSGEIGASMPRTAPPDPLFTHDGLSSYDSGFLGSSAGPHDAWVATDADGHDRIVEVRAPGDYDFATATRSPDEQWVLIRTTAADLLIADLDGNVRTLREGDDDEGLLDGFVPFVSEWFQPGNVKGTVDVKVLRNSR